MIIETGTLFGFAAEINPKEPIEIDPRSAGHSALR